MFFHLLRIVVQPDVGIRFRADLVQRLQAHDLLNQAIHAAASGDALIAPSITARLLATFADSHARQPPAQPIEPLTTREEEILTPVAQGWTNHEIADDLHISVSTVKTHLASLMRKLSARNRVEIAMWAYETRRIDT